jgi:hypothetical protein
VQSKVVFRTRSKFLRDKCLRRTVLLLMEQQQYSNGIPPYNGREK